MDEVITKETDPETERLVSIVRAILQALGVSNLEIARRLGMSPSDLSELLSGAADIRLDHVVRICRAVEMEPGEFFHLVYPPAPRASFSPDRLRELLEGIRPMLSPLPPRPE